jgi:hypothetical protein
LVFAFSSSTALAIDPFTLLLLRMLRDQAISAGIESGLTSSQQDPKPESRPVWQTTPLPSGEGPWLKSLIDESFVHLEPRQREELYGSLNRMLSDPKNADVRPAIVAEFTAQAIAVRDAHRQLSRMSQADMRRVAVDARAEFERLPAEERKQLMEALQRGVPGMPRALQDMVLAEFNGASSAR